MTDNVATTRAYFAALSRGVSFHELSAYYDPDVTQVEYPNRLLSQGAERDLQALGQAHARGEQAVDAQSYTLHTVLSDGDWVALRLTWSAQLKRALGQSAQGVSIKADFAVFLQFRAGRIVGQHNYDCFAEF